MQFNPDCILSLPGALRFDIENQFVKQFSGYPQVLEPRWCYFFLPGADMYSCVTRRSEKVNICGRVRSLSHGTNLYPVLEPAQLRDACLADLAGFFRISIKDMHTHRLRDCACRSAVELSRHCADRLVGRDVFQTQACFDHQARTDETASANRRFIQSSFGPGHAYG